MTSSIPVTPLPTIQFTTLPFIDADALPVAAPGEIVDEWTTMLEVVVDGIVAFTYSMRRGNRGAVHLEVRIRRRPFVQRVLLAFQRLFS